MDDGSYGGIRIGPLVFLYAADPVGGGEIVAGEYAGQHGAYYTAQAMCGEHVDGIIEHTSVTLPRHSHVAADGDEIRNNLQGKSVINVMADTMTPEQRHRCMAAIKGRDTKPEMTVRRFLFAKGLRYRVNNRRLPGCPDIVLKKYKTVVFVDGCFWHGHEGCRFYRLPRTNQDFWRHKIAMNYARDYANNIELQLAGWRVIRIWECQIKTKSQQLVTLENLYRQITGQPPMPIPSRDDDNTTAKPVPYSTDEPPASIAAEPLPDS